MSAPLAARRRELTDEVTAFIGRCARADEGGEGGGGIPSEAELEKLALAVFAFQFEAIAPYQRLCMRQGLTPDRVTRWRQIPAVPAEAFKAFTLFAAGDDVVRTFRSSGTTDPSRSSQAHFSRGGLELMDAAVVANARRSLFVDIKKARILVLAPSPQQAPHMIMVHGMAHLMKTFGLDGSRFMLGPKGLDPAELWDELSRCQKADVPVALLGSSFGFVHFFDWMEAEHKKLALPEGSRLMDAGGYKGRSREIGRAQFVAWASAMCGVPVTRVVNLLGMTELASQIYDKVAPEAGGAERMKLSPPWMRTVVVDPRRQGGDGPSEVESGEQGLLRHLDLANVERPMVVQSEDVGRQVVIGGQRGFEIHGRAKGAEPRGCSLSADELQQKREAS
jgi:Acyl-protein synthetase, LuxE